MSEAQRGCGYRKIGGLYLMCDPGLTLNCDGLPMPMNQCDCCGFAPPFSRNLQKLNPKYVFIAHREHQDPLIECTCPDSCPICFPEMPAEISERALEQYGAIKSEKAMKYFGLMFVGKRDYSCRTFIQEAELMGISKRIPMIPSWLTLGETWILLAHNEVPKVSLEEIKSNEMHMKEPQKFRAVFYAFKPQRIEMPVWKDQISAEEIILLEKKGVTPVLLDPTPENKKKHGTAQNRKVLRRLLEPIDEEETE